MKKIVLVFLIFSLVIGLLEMFGYITLSKWQNLIKYISISLMLIYLFFNNKLNKNN